MYIFATMKLSKVAQLAIKGDPNIREFILFHYSISRQTLHTWCNNNHIKLMRDPVLSYMAKQLKVKKSILTDNN